MMTNALYAVYGAAGYGREVMPMARDMLRHGGLSADRLVFVDDGSDLAERNTQRILPYSEFLAESATQRFAAIAIADAAVREKLANRLIEDGVSLWSLKGDNVVILDDVELGEGAILSPFVMLTSNIRIGRCFHANIYSYVAHDCVIGDFVTFAPGVKCNGNVVVEDHAYIGTGAILRQGKPDKPLVIGKGAVVGMGAVVTKDVAPGTTVVGNPARVFERGGA